MLRWVIVRRGWKGSYFCFGKGHDSYLSCFTRSLLRSGVKDSSRLENTQRGLKKAQRTAQSLVQGSDWWRRSHVLGNILTHLQVFGTQSVEGPTTRGLKSNNLSNQECPSRTKRAGLSEATTYIHLFQYPFLLPSRSLLKPLTAVIERQSDTLDKSPVLCWVTKDIPHTHPWTHLWTIYFTIHLTYMFLDHGRENIKTPRKCVRIFFNNINDGLDLCGTSHLKQFTLNWWCYDTCKATAALG